MWLATVLLCTIVCLLVAMSVAAVILIGSLGGREQPTDAVISDKSSSKRGGPVLTQSVEIVINRPDQGPTTSGQRTPPPPTPMTPTVPPTPTTSRAPYVPPDAPEGSKSLCI
uniref:Putative secreted protein ovary overexpressed n=1 Tax=Rhipicephalus microplus TaxID=6941 RepID=A0A6M2D9G6_RHIMP